MASPISAEAQTCLFLSALLMGVAAYLLSHTVFGAVYRDHNVMNEHWKLGELRWQRLRQTSLLFRLLERWVLALDRVLLMYLGWFISEPTTNTKLQAYGKTLLKILLGNPRRLQESVKILSCQQPWTASELIAAHLLVAASVAILVSLLCLGELPAQWMLYAAPILGWLVLQTLNYQVNLRASLRRRSIRNFLPHAMDSISMVVSAGDPFDRALDLIIQDFPNHPLSEEFRRLRLNLERGQTKGDALAEIDQAICLPEFHEMTTILQRVNQHGVPVADSFARMAKHLRTKHLRYLEEEIGRAEASISLPTMLVMFSCLLVVVAPFVLSFAQTYRFE